MNKQKTLSRNTSCKVLGGVCSGIAEYFDASPSLIRFLWVLFPILCCCIIALFSSPIYIFLGEVSVSAQNIGGAEVFNNADFTPLLEAITPFLNNIINFAELASYLLFLAMFFFSFFFGVMPYLLLWLIMPEAKKESNE